MADIFHHALIFCRTCGACTSQVAAAAVSPCCKCGCHCGHLYRDDPFGRAYLQSMLCPLGIMQDFFYWLAKRRKKGRHNAVHIPENRRVRYGVLAAVLLSLILGISPVVTALDPYSIFGRIVTDLLTVPVSYIFLPQRIFLCCSSWLGAAGRWCTAILSVRSGHCLYGQPAQPVPPRHPAGGLRPLRAL